MVRTQRSHCQGLGSIPGRGTKILQALRRGGGGEQTSDTPNKIHDFKNIILSERSQNQKTIAV